MFRSFKRVSAGILIALAVLAGAGWVLIKTLGNHEHLYAGKSIDYWRQQANSKDAGASNQACAFVREQVIPQLVDQMFHDTNDSNLRLSLIELLNGLPGVQIVFTEANDRRARAVVCLAGFGPAGKTAVPALIQALKGKDASVRGPATRALGAIHSDPDLLIPLLIKYLDDGDVNAEAAYALGDFGPLAKPAIPKLIPLLHAQDKDTRAAAIVVLKKIDPEAYKSDNHKF